MKKHKIYIIIAVTLVAAAGLFNAGPVGAAGYAGEFLEIGVGSRASAMGGAFSTLADDGFGFYWTPAGCAKVFNLQFSGMYVPLYGGFGSSLADYHHIGFSMPFAGATLGLNWIRLSVSDIPQFPNYNGLDYNSRRNLIIGSNGSPAGYFSDSEDAFYFTFARLNDIRLDLGWQYFVIPLEIPIGVNFKIIRQSLAGYSAFGMGADAGMQFRFSLEDVLTIKGLGDFALALNYQDFTQTGIDWGDSGSDAIPANLKWGLGFFQELPFIKSKINLTYDRDNRWEIENHYGAEIIYLERYALRLGHEFHGWTAGAGVQYKNFILDYAFLNTDLGAVNRISATYIIQYRN